jgi:mannose-6-phosphate isomerase-like protein (cupin superfamily)
MIQTHSLAQDQIAQGQIAQAGQNFAVADLGAFAGLKQFTFSAPGASFQVEGKVFLHDLLRLTSAEISLNNLPPKKSMPFYHKHRQNEEVYIFVQGQGEFQVDGVIFSVTQGSVVRVDPEGERCIRNTSGSDDLCFVVIQSRAGSYLDHTIQDGVAVEKRVSWLHRKGGEGEAS